MYVCMHACMFYMNVSTYVFMRICKYVCMYVDELWMSICYFIPRKHSNVMYVCMYYMYVCMKFCVTLTSDLMFTIPG